MKTEPTKPDAFALARESTDSGRRAPRVVETGKSKQGALFAGADCIAGQKEFFNPNGSREVA